MPYKKFSDNGMFPGYTPWKKGPDYSYDVEVGGTKAPEIYSIAQSSSLSDYRDSLAFKQRYGYRPYPRTIELGARGRDQTQMYKRNYKKWPQPELPVPMGGLSQEQKYPADESPFSPIVPQPGSKSFDELFSEERFVKYLNTYIKKYKFAIILESSRNSLESYIKSQEKKVDPKTLTRFYELSRNMSQELHEIKTNLDTANAEYRKYGMDLKSGVMEIIKSEYEDSGGLSGLEGPERVVFKVLDFAGKIYKKIPAEVRAKTWGILGLGSGILAAGYAYKISIGNDPVVEAINADPTKTPEQKAEILAKYRQDKGNWMDRLIEKVKGAGSLLTASIVGVGLFFIFVQTGLVKDIFGWVTRPGLFSKKDDRPYSKRKKYTSKKRVIFERESDPIEAEYEVR